MARSALVAWIGVVTACWGLGASAASRNAECGPIEDADRASYRMLALADFAGNRPREPGRSRRGGSTSVLITTAIAVDEARVSVEREPSGSYHARLSSLCVRAYFFKGLSGRKSELSPPWELAHEQGHFDLTESYARLLEAHLSRLSAQAASESDAERLLRLRVRSDYTDHARELQREHDRYDRETRHGNHRSAQGRWSREMAARISAGRMAAPSGPHREHAALPPNAEP